MAEDVADAGASHTVQDTAKLEDTASPNAEDGQDAAPAELDIAAMDSRASDSTIGDGEVSQGLDASGDADAQTHFDVPDIQGPDSSEDADMSDFPDVADSQALDSFADVDAVAAPDADDGDIAADGCDGGASCDGTDVDVCVSVDCNDDDPCTQDICYPEIGCTHVVVPGCGDNPCGECPADLGFECVEQPPVGQVCRNLLTDEVFVPGGTFFLGCDPNKVPGCPSEGCFYDAPMRRAYLPSFSIDRTEVTNGQYAECIEQGACTLSPAGPPGPSLPATGLNFGEASEYCKSQGKHVCSEALWEKAARGGCAVLGCAETDVDCCRTKTPVFPWGDSPPTCEKAHVRWGDLDCKQSWTDLLPVGSLPDGASPYGALDMVGNAIEWAWMLVDSYLGLPEADPVILAQDTLLWLPTCFIFDHPVLYRGSDGFGSIVMEPWPPVRVSYRSPATSNPSEYGLNLGFRCCRVWEE